MRKAKMNIVKDIYKEGDKVLVREWDDMKKEYALDESGSIVIPDCNYVFNSFMQKYCGTVLTILMIDCHGNYHMKDDEDRIVSQMFTERMFEGKVIDEAEEDDDADNTHEKCVINRKIKRLRELVGEIKSYDDVLYMHEGDIIDLNLTKQELWELLQTF